MGSEYKWEGLDRMEQELAKMIDHTYPKEFEALVMQIAYKLQEKVKTKTPIGPTGRLSDGWKVGKIKKVGDTYFIEVYSNVEYVEHVEFGHRIPGGDGFVPGVHMMEISLEEISRELPGALRAWLSEFISTHDL